MDCPLPTARYDTITLAHGGGGTLTAALIHEIFLPAFGASGAAPHDATLFQLGGRRAAFTTDSYVVQPLFFPGGDIGTLAVNGTVNDLLMAGAKPVALTAGLSLTASLNELVISLLASWNSRMERPRARPSSGRRWGPKMMRATMMMRIRWVG